MKNAPYPLLDQEFFRLKAGHRKALRSSAARAVTGPSVMRVYKSGTKEVLMPILAEKIDMDRLSKIRDQKTFSDWYDAQLHHVARAIERRNKANRRISPGAKMGSTPRRF